MKIEANPFWFLDLPSGRWVGGGQVFKLRAHVFFAVGTAERPKLRAFPSREQPAIRNHG